MYSLHDMTSVFPKLETVSDEGEFDEDDNESNHSDGQTDRMSEEFPLSNNAENLTTGNDDYRFQEGNSTNVMGPHRQASEIPPDQTAGTSSMTAGRTAVSMGKTERQIKNGYTMAPVYGNGCQEALYYSARAAGRMLDAGINANSVESRKVRQQSGVPERMPAHQSSIYGTMPHVPMPSKGEFSPYQGLSVYSGSHRSLTPYEMGIPLKPCCNCPCHLPASSPVPEPAPAPEMKSQRPSVIMVPAKNNPSREASAKMDKMPLRLGSENVNRRQNLQYVGYYEMADLDSSDDDEDGRHEKYFRVNIDGTTARFKLTKEDWERIPINTFPSGGRLLSGDWTRIFLSKVGESNPWCSLRFKNNHVRSENSRKIHSAVFFRGGAECKRPECNVKVRFVIRKERGKYVDVTYVGNVCHSRQPGGSDVTNDKKRKYAQVRRTRISPTCESD